MKVLILDDDVGRVSTFEQRTGLVVLHARNGREFMAILSSQSPFDLIMLDHDLQDFSGPEQSEWTGANAAKYLAEHEEQFAAEQLVIIHSANPIGVANMQSHLKRTSRFKVSVLWGAWQKASYIDGVLRFDAWR